MEANLSGGVKGREELGLGLMQTKKRGTAGDMVSWQSVWLARMNFWVQCLTPYKSGVALYTIYQSTQGVEAGGSEVEGHSRVWDQLGLQDILRQRIKEAARRSKY